MATLHVLLQRQDLDPGRLAGKVVVVLDVLFATTTIVQVLAAGAAAIHPARDAVDADRLAGGLPGCRKAGEDQAQPIPGFAPPTPLALSALDVHGATVVYATSNGTVALADVAAAEAVYAGALSNGEALAAHVARAHPDCTVLLLCAGSASRFNLEDFYGAGHLASHFERLGGYRLTDAALAALLLARGCTPAQALGASRVGRQLVAAGHGDEVDCAARCDAHAVVPRLRDGCLRAEAA